jgi:peptide/nickel transport system permease protein
LRDRYLTGARRTLKLGKNPLVLAGAAILVIALGAAVFAPWLATHPVNEMNLPHRLIGPGHRGFYLGTDVLGRDIYSRLLFGARVSLLVGFVVVSITAALGSVVGAVSGYYGGAVDEILMRLVDILLAFPGILLAIGFVAVLGPDLKNVVFALSLIGWVGYARFARGQVLKEKEMEYVAAARASGASDARILFVHIFPNLAGPLLVQATLGIAGVILAESSLSFLGLGVQPPQPSWGSMLNEGRLYLYDAPHLALFPGLAILLVVLAFNFFGDGLRDALDPKSR